MQIRETINKILLFISAFVPMYVLLLFKFVIEIITKKLTKDFLNIFMVIFLSILIILGIIGVKLLLGKQCKKSEQITLLKTHNTTDQHFLSYFSLFVLFALTFELEKMSMTIVFIAILVFIGIVYIKNNLFHINPLLNILGYSFYIITCTDENNNNLELKVFYKGNLQENSSYYLCNILKNFIVIKNHKTLINKSKKKH